MTNNPSGINTEIKVNGQRLETVTRFKYLGSVKTYEGSKPEILSRTAQTTAALTRLKPVWNDRSISLSSKIHRCAPLSHPSSCMFVNHGPSQKTIVKRRKPQWYGHVSRSSDLAKTILQRHRERVKKTRQPEKEVGSQHQGMDRPGVRQVPEGSGEQKKMEETGCEVTCGAPTTRTIKG